MDIYLLGKAIGELTSDMHRLQSDQKCDRKSLKKIKADLYKQRRILMLVAIWATAANGFNNSDQISTIAAAAIRKLLIGL